eukprot:TRINITY_DN10891_c0_g2_i1.p1 TRINITY_DN10891_c0_g2~~TRINITY_DN10891_c0_g2_i1.p1  ORF type:complete len:204 (-),score=63.74 TRINITY_DN10891_c0_g2_i1:60-671(-)
MCIRDRTTGLLFQMLRAKQFGGALKTAPASKKFDFEVNLRCDKKQVNDSGYLTDCFALIVERLIESLAINSNKVVFPDLIVFVHVNLKRISARLRSSVLKKELREVYKIVRDHGQLVSYHRRKAGFTPLESEKQNTFSSTIQADENQLLKRYEELEEKRKSMITQKILAEQQVFYVAKTPRQDKSQKKSKKDDPVKKKKAVKQ